VVETGGVAADGREHVAQEGAAAAADVEQPVRGSEREGFQRRLPQERVRVVGAVRRACPSAMRATRHPVGLAVDPPLAQACDGAHGEPS
jgi:hypothetical protein